VGLRERIVIARWRKTTGMWADTVTVENGRASNYIVRPRRLRQPRRQCNISKNYYMRPERPVHQTLRTLRTLTVTLDATSAGRHVRTPFAIYPGVLDVPTTSSTKRMRPDTLRRQALPHPDDRLPVPPSSWRNPTPL